MKKCKDCKGIKKEGQFYGVQGECKECTKIRVKKRYNDPKYRQIIAEYERKRFQDPKRKEKISQYQINRNQRKPGKYRVRTKLGNSIRDGKIKRLPCEVCGNPRSEGHHKDYRKPLDVKWLCFKHHRQEHNQKTN